MESSKNQVGACTRDRVGALEVGASELTRLEPWKDQVGAWQNTGCSLEDWSLHLGLEPYTITVLNLDRKSVV